MSQREDFLIEKRKEGTENLKIILHMLKRTYTILANDAGVNPTKINSVFNISRNYEELEWVRIFKKIYEYIDEDKPTDYEFIVKKLELARQQILYFDAPDEIIISSLNYVNPTLSVDNPSYKIVELLNKKQRLLYFISDVGSGSDFTIKKCIIKILEKSENNISV